MIAVVDFGVKGHSHDIFNAGALNQLSEAYPNEDVYFFAEESHVCCVKALLQSDYNWIKVFPIDYKIGRYSEIIYGIIRDFGHPEFVVITSFEGDRIHEFEEFAISNESTDIYICLHGIIELLIENVFYENRWPQWYLFKNRIVYSVRRYLFMIRHNWFINSKRDKQLGNIFRKGMLRLSELRNIHYLVFSTAYDQFKDRIDPSIRKKMIKIWLPYVFKDVSNTHVDSQIMTIGIVPSVAYDPSAYAYRIIDVTNALLKEKSTLNKVQFVFFRSKTSDKENCIEFTNNSFARENLNLFIQSCDYVLQAIGEKKYQLSSSGFVMDVISQDTPLLMFSSHCFDDLMKYNIGYRAGSTEEMAKLIVDLAKAKDKGRRNELSKNVRNLKWKMNERNIETLRGLKRGV